MFVCGNRAVSTENILTIVILNRRCGEADTIRINYRDGQVVDLLIPENMPVRQVFFDLLSKIKRDEKNS